MLFVLCVLYILYVFVVIKSLTNEAVATRAAVGIDGIDARATVLTRRTSALVDVLFAQRALVAGHARASVAVDAVIAGAPELARRRRTLVDVRLAVRTCRPTSA